MYNKHWLFYFPDMFSRIQIISMHVSVADIFYNIIGQ